MIPSLCKICGAPIEISNTSRFAKCEYCGSNFELDPNRAVFANLYSTADDAWGRKDFDEALRCYLEITEKDNLQSEAHWGAALCRYGIAYEIDPVSGQKMPTCNRTNKDSIFEDKNYISAIKHASPENKQKYLLRATEIDRISAEFLKIVESEPPCDVFISYKRTDERGLKTIDAEYAMKLYLFLKNHGVKVFFAEESLKDVAGSLYEPHIFAALHSARVMVLFGSSRENIESTWVKNEWQRFLKLSETSPEKALLPVFLGDPYQVLPQRLQPLQSFHAGSPAFLEEILEIVKKKLYDSVRPPSADASANLVTLGSLLERAKMLLADGEFDKSSQQLEKVLDIDPKCAEAYLCGLLIEFRLTREEDFNTLVQRIDLSPNYKKIMSFGSDALKQRILAYSDEILQRIGKAELYRQALQQKKEALSRSVDQANRALQAIDIKRGSLKKEISQEESRLSFLQNRIDQAKKTRDSLKKPSVPPIFWGILGLILNAAAFLLVSYDCDLSSSLYYLLPALIIFSILTYHSLSLGAPFAGIGIVFLVGVVVALTNISQFFGAILAILWNITIGLLLDSPQELPWELVAEVFFFSAQALYLVALFVSFFRQKEVSKITKQYKELNERIDRDTAEYNAKLQENVELMNLQKELAQENTNYNTQFENYKRQIQAENREYMELARSTGQKAEGVVPAVYLHN